MKQLLTIYESTHPYVAIVSKRALHLNEAQYLAIIEDMGAGKGSTVITYHDPVSKEDRDIPVNLYKIEMLDKAKIVREELWKSQGGYVCKDGQCVDSPEDCGRADGYKKYEEVSDFAKTFTQQNKLQLRKDKQAKFLAGYLVGKTFGFYKYMGEIQRIIERHGEKVFENNSDYDKKGYETYKKFMESPDGVAWLDNRGQRNVLPELFPSDWPKEAVRMNIQKNVAAGNFDPEAGERAIKFIDEN